MKIRKAFLSLLVTAMLCPQVFASVRDGRIITENPSVRAAGMGYAYVANTVGDVFGLFSNPAHRADSPMLGFMYSTLFKDGETVSEEATGAFAFVYPDLFLGVTAGIAAVSSMEGNIENKQDIAAYLNLSKEINFLNIGANIKYVDSEYYGDNGSGSVDADFGLLAEFGILSIGAAGYNLAGSFKDADGESIAPSISAGAALNLHFDSLMFVLEADGIQRTLDEDKINPRAGIEMFYKWFALRGGYEYYEDLEDKGIFSAGFGLDIKDFLFDYSFASTGNKDDGQMHKAALSYRFNKTPKVNNEQFKQQVKLEKQQAKMQEKLKKERAKRQKNEEAELAKKSRQDDKKSEALPLQPVNYNESENEFVAVLAPVEMEYSVGARLAAKDTKVAYYKPTEIKSGDFDAAAYLLELERSKASGQSGTKGATREARQHYYQATPHSEGDYDPAKELLAKSGVSEAASKARYEASGSKKPEMKIVGGGKPQKEDTEEIRNVKKQKPDKQKTAKAKKQKRGEKNVSVEDDEFDAARYILENPGQSKIKQYYVKPTETSKDEFDAALYLLQLEKEKNQTP